MFKKYEQLFENEDYFKSMTEPIMVLASTDGSRHCVSIEGDCNIISFNMCIINKLLLKEGYTTTQSHNILTYKQVASEEDADVLLTVY